jgi:hypothetical protein
MVQSVLSIHPYLNSDIFNPIFVIRVEPCGLVILTPQITIVLCLTKIQKEKKNLRVKR